MKKDTEEKIISKDDVTSINISNDLLYAYAAFIGIFHFYVNIWQGISTLWFNAIHFSLLGSFVFFNSLLHTKKLIVKIINVVFALLAMSAFFYFVFFEESLYAGGGVTNIRYSDMIIAFVSIVIVSEGIRRTSGLLIPILILFSVLYILWIGQYFEGIFNFRGMGIDRYAYRVFFTDEGIFGPIATISSSYLFMFMLFGAFLLKSGAGEFIIRLSMLLTYKMKGGSAYVSILSSALMGTISGSAVSNTVSTGAITIPLMKKTGFRPKFAAAVETASSTGGQIMPPIMGAGIFIMSQRTGLPISTIIFVSILPAILYFFSIACYVFIQIRKFNIDCDEKEEPEKLSVVLKEGLHFILPIIILLMTLTNGSSPTYAATISIISIIGCSYLKRGGGMRLKDVMEAFALGTTNMVSTGLLLVGIGIIVGAINISGIGIAFSQMIPIWADGNLVIALLLVAIVSLILGMGLPVVASYLVLSVLTAPTLVTMMMPLEMSLMVNQGINVAGSAMYLLSAHLIVFWLSQDSNLTPPVCLAAFAAAAIAKTKPMRTGFTAWKIGKGLYIVPFLFAFSPLVTGDFFAKVNVFIFSLFGILTFCILYEQYWQRKLDSIDNTLLAGCVIALFSRDSFFGLSDMMTILDGDIQIINVIGLALALLFFTQHKSRKYSKHKRKKIYYKDV